MGSTQGKERTDPPPRLRLGICALTCTHTPQGREDERGRERELSELYKTYGWPGQGLLEQPHPCYAVCVWVWSPSSLFPEAAVLEELEQLGSLELHCGDENVSADHTVN